MASLYTWDVLPINELKNVKILRKDGGHSEVDTIGNPHVATVNIPYGKWAIAANLGTSLRGNGVKAIYDNPKRHGGPSESNDVTFGSAEDGNGDGMFLVRFGKSESDEHVGATLRTPGSKIRGTSSSSRFAFSNLQAHRFLMSQCLKNKTIEELGIGTENCIVPPNSPPVKLYRNDLVCKTDSAGHSYIILRFKRFGKILENAYSETKFDKNGQGSLFNVEEHIGDSINLENYINE